MHRGVLTCAREASLSEVARVMAERSIHCVVVENDSGDGGPFWGVVSDLDLIAAATVATSTSRPPVALQLAQSSWSRRRKRSNALRSS